nr:MAG TPA: hypothetical protein [Caudoviricetes sp.]
MRSSWQHSAPTCWRRHPQPWPWRRRLGTRAHRAPRVSDGGA